MRLFWFFLTDAGDEHIARVEDVTMQEEAPIPPDEIIPGVINLFCSNSF